MRTLKFTLAYDGTNYVGWQRQAAGASIQQALESAFAPLVDPGSEPPGFVGAGRTDAGVHALGQVASVVTGVGLAAPAVQRAMNVRLPPDIRVVGVVDARPGFHARYDARAKVYRYRIATTPVVSPFDRWFVWPAPRPLDVEAMRTAAGSLAGRHDFASLQAAGSPVADTVRTIHRLDVAETAGEVAIEVEGDGFLRHMVRTLAGLLVEVGTGERDVASVEGVLASRDRSAAGRTLPARGLTLVSVRYAAAPAGGARLLRSGASSDPYGPR